LEVFVPVAVSRRQVIGVVGVVKLPPTLPWSRALLKVWSRLDTRGSRKDRVAASVGAPGRSAAREVPAGDRHAAVLPGHHHLVMTQVVNLAALVALAQDPRRRGLWVLH
jgi:hypothetical protein